MTKEEYNIPLLLLLKRLTLALALLSLGRIVFWIFNANQFQWPGLIAAMELMFWGSYFDLISLFYVLSPIILVHLIPGPWFNLKSVQKGIKIFYSILLFLLLTLICIDAGYYPFSKTRLGVELFQMAGEEDISVWQYIKDYWWFVPVILLSIFGLWKMYPELKGPSRLKWYLQIPINILFLALLILTIRGGFRLKPLRSIDTALFVPPTHAMLAISTGFNFLESFQVENIKVPAYFSEAEQNEFMKGDYFELKPENAALSPKNIVIIILESFGKEYSFPENNLVQSYTPFLQELASKSTLYQRAYSNGTRSVDAIPAILEGVPKLTKTDFMYSNYIKNQTPGFPFYLGKEGYSCAFYHGGKNGTLGFEAFLKSKGWLYFGKDEYEGMEADFDGQWGIFDEPYLNYFANRLKQTQQPFVNAIFTLSSHHPYTLPPQFKDSFKDAQKPIHRTVRYTDYCLRQFFKNIEKEAWFKETVFIITGDHSSENFTKQYQSRYEKYAVPILVYKPGNPQQKESEAIVQHIDIIPLALSSIGYSGQIFTLSSYFKKGDLKVAFQNEEGSYLIIGPNYSYTFNGETEGNYTKLNSEIWADSLNQKTYLKQELKQKIQDYSFRLLNNKLY